MVAFSTLCSIVSGFTYIYDNKNLLTNIFKTRLIVLTREFLVMLIRLLANKQNKVIAANILSFLRIIMVPFFVFFLNFKEKNSQFAIISLIIFIVASITDFLDGLIARHKKIITNLKKFLDPLADKILITGAFLCFLKYKLG